MKNMDLPEKGVEKRKLSTGRQAAGPDGKRRKKKFDSLNKTVIKHEGNDAKKGKGEKQKRPLWITTGAGRTGQRDKDHSGAVSERASKAQEMRNRLKETSAMQRPGESR